ncbi:hypothetical protein U9M48_030570 [Paspalum notatum var. saurae]|uniref:Transposase MuDR plant domain-containing protein n=1 Tax=Paspalum notatum var. saurae TaxID=547442 RepID=A0AAQ3X3E3_PASNO
MLGIGDSLLTGDEASWRSRAVLAGSRGSVLGSRGSVLVRSPLAGCGEARVGRGWCAARGSVAAGGDARGVAGAGAGRAARGNGMAGADRAGRGGTGAGHAGRGAAGAGRAGRGGAGAGRAPDQAARRPSCGSNSRSMNQQELTLVIKVQSFWSLPDGGPKTYSRRQTLTTAVEMNGYGLLQLVDYIGERFVWGSKQYITLWRSLEDASIEIKTDEHLLEWFQLNQEKGAVHIDAPLKFSPTKRRFHPSVRNNVEPTPGTPPLDLDPPVNPTQPTQEMIEPTNDDEEPIGVDEEETYSDTESLVAPGDSSYDSQLAASSDSDGSDLEYEPDEEIIDEDDEDALSVFSYDVDDPCVDISVVFPNLKQCKSALTHHAILNDYAFHKGCNCIFFASTSKKSVGCKVKRNGPLHTCGSVNNCGDTLVTQNWVVERVVDLLKENPIKGPHELQAELKKKFSIEIPYYKIFRGKEKALDMIFGN